MLHGGDVQVNRGHREGVGADAAAKVNDPVQPGVTVSTGVQGRDAQTGRLLEAGRGEEHSLGEGSELGFGASAEPRLVQHRRDEHGGVAGLAQFGDRANDIACRVPPGQGGEKTEAVCRQQFAQLGGIHSATVAIGTRVD